MAGRFQQSDHLGQHAAVSGDGPQRPRWVYDGIDLSCTPVAPHLSELRGLFERSCPISPMISMIRCSLVKNVLDQLLRAAGAPGPLGALGFLMSRLTDSSCRRIVLETSPALTFQARSFSLPLLPPGEAIGELLELDGLGLGVVLAALRAAAARSTRCPWSGRSGRRTAGWSGCWCRGRRRRWAGGRWCAG